MNIMIVDDEQDVKILFQQKFRREIRAGKVVLHFAFSGQSALEYLEQASARFALVLSDINMPGMSGLELLQRIRSRFETLQVWMITAYSDDHNFKQAQEYGCADYMTKPLDFDLLKRKIMSAMPAD